MVGHLVLRIVVHAVVFEVRALGGGVVAGRGVPELGLFRRVEAVVFPAVALCLGGEEHGRVLAVRGRVAIRRGVGARCGTEVGEVLHVDLEGGGRDVVAVVVVDPGAGWLGCGQPVFGKREGGKDVGGGWVGGWVIDLLGLWSSPTMTLE